MAANFLRAFDLASPDTREQVIIGIAERLGQDELRFFQDARRRSEHRVDILCGTSNVSRAQLPHEIQLQIVGLLGVTDLYYCTNVCHQWRCLLLQCRQLTDDLLKKHFPGYFDEMRDGPETLHQALRKRYLRDSARFRTRQVSPLPCLTGTSQLTDLLFSRTQDLPVDSSRMPMEPSPWIALKAYSEAEPSKISPAPDLSTFDHPSQLEQQAIRRQKYPLFHIRARAVL